MLRLALAALLLTTTGCATTTATTATTSAAPLSPSCYDRGKAAGRVESTRPTPDDCGAMYWLGRMVGAPAPEYRSRTPLGEPISRK